MKQDMILILDLGSDRNPQLAREIRALGVYSEIHPHDITLEQLHALPNVKGIILNGGPNRVVDGVEIDVSKEQLAKYLSVSRASLFRALGALTAQGLIVPEGAGYRITDPTALGRI